MSLAPLRAAAPAIPLHAFAAMTACVLGVVQLAAPKGTLPHRTLGWIWVSLMLGVAISRRRPCDRGPVHPAAGTDHARRGVRPVGPSPRTRCGAVSEPRKNCRRTGSDGGFHEARRGVLATA